jgi:hypothetical protein
MSRRNLRAAGLVAALVTGLGAFAGAAPATSSTAPSNTSRPTITGTAQEGQTLTGHNGGWTGTEPITYAFQWLRCNAAGASCSDLAGASSQTYVVKKEDVGSTIRVRVTASNAEGSASANSDQTAVATAQPATAPSNSSPPTIAGTPQDGQSLSAGNGSWNGTQPIANTYQWQRCDQNGASCADVAGATAQTYKLGSADVGRTVRVVVTASNAGGRSSASSAPTGVVQPAGPADQIELPSGQTSIPATSVAPPERLIVDSVRFTPNPVRSRAAPITVRVHVSDTRGYVVRGALVFLRSTPLVTSTPAEQATDTSGYVTFTTTLFAAFPLRNGYNVQFFVRARKEGDDVLAGVSTRRLVQVRSASAR